jgi:hypothetical protein
MRLSASRIRSINRRLARAQGFTWPARDKNCRPMSGGITPPIVSRNVPAIIKVIAVARDAAA